MPSAFMIWPATSPNGFPTGLTAAITRRAKIRTRKDPPPANTKSFVAAPGPIPVPGSVYSSATGFGPHSERRTSASAAHSSLLCSEGAKRLLRLLTHRKGLPKMFRGAVQIFASGERRPQVQMRLAEIGADGEISHFTLQIRYVNIIPKSIAARSIQLGMKLLF